MLHTYIRMYIHICTHRMDAGDVICAYTGIFSGGQNYRLLICMAMEENMLH